MRAAWNEKKNKTLGTLQLLYLTVYSLRQIRPILEECTVFCSALWLMFVLFEFLDRRSFIDPICCNS